MYPRRTIDNIRCIYNNISLNYIQKKVDILGKFGEILVSRFGEVAESG